MHEASTAFSRASGVLDAALPEDERFALTDAAIRRALERMPDLSSLEEQLLFRVCCLSLQRGFAWIGQAQLAELLRYSERAVRDATKRMCERGLLVTVRLRDGLRYFPQWQELDLSPSVVPFDRPAKTAGSDRQILPMHRGSTKGSTRASSRAEPQDAPRRDAAARSFVRKEEDPAPKPSPVEFAELGAVADRFGPRAERDVRAVLASESVQRQPEAGRAALARLLQMEPGDVRTTPGACFHGFVKLALEGRLSTPEPERGRAAPPEPERECKLDPAAQAALRTRRHEVRDQLDRVWLDREKAAPLRAELAAIDAQLPPRFTVVPAHVPYENRDGQTGRSLVESIRKLRHAPPRVVAVTAQQLEPEEAAEVVRVHAGTHLPFAAAVAAQLDPHTAAALAQDLGPALAISLLEAVRAFDAAAAVRLEDALAGHHAGAEA